MSFRGKKDGMIPIRAGHWYDFDQKCFDIDPQDTIQFSKNDHYEKIKRIGRTKSLD